MDVAASAEVRPDGVPAVDRGLVLLVVPGEAASDSPKIVGASDAVCLALGYPREELVGKPLTLVCGERAPDELRVRFRSAVFHGREERGASAVYHRCGDPLWAEWSLRTVTDGTRGTVCEITIRIVDRRRPADGDLRALVTAIENSTDAVLIYEQRNGHDEARVQFANRAAELQTGYSRKELENVSRVGPRTDLDALTALQAAVKRGESVRSRLRYYRRDGTSYWAELNVKPLLETVPGEARWLSIERDVTDQVEREGLIASELDAYATLAAAAEAFLDANDRSRLDYAYHDARQRLVASARREATGVLDSMYESALRRLRLYEDSVERRVETAQAQAAQADAMALLAHDIRGPLNTVIGFTELIEEACADRDDVGEYTRFVIRAANRVVDLCNEIVVAAQLDRNEYKPAVERFDLLSLIESVVTLLPGGDRATFFFPAGELELEADMSGVRHIIGNLTSNALKYSDSSKRIEIAVEPGEDAVRIVVRDEGIGIPSGELATIFERFSRASNARGSAVRGTGLGLYFVKQLIERNAGTIDVASEQNVGTTVTVALPRRRLGSFDIPAILSLEPETEERSLVATELRKRGYVVRVVQTPTAAESIVLRERVGLVVVDADTFPLHTLEVLKVVCEDHRVHVLACGSASDSALPDQLRTPFVGEELSAKVEQALTLLGE